ncbi:GltB/FmdC/FwdC-like GXGXG domain-containing protein [Rhodococcus globerulus]|uniref:Protein glxC n=1 Tax=Rhodococcus globerulus TaxID=33008 RepID=A0ABU4C4G3_RHOGO|nr:protein glxC [Rhodococcus globerulus]MDV6271248.1 protein glxC [Rhodococcus globerulus]
MAPSVTTTQEIATPEIETRSIDLQSSSTREVNELLSSPDAPKSLTITQPQGAHALACGLDAELDVTIEGHVGYYCAGMNQKATVTVTGNAGVGVAENMMSGRVHIKGDASQSAGATAHGGLLVVDGNAAARCGISMKGVDIVVGGNIGHMSAFMGQAGRLVVCGDAGEALGDSIYEARIYVRGTVASLGADCIKKEMQHEHLAELKELLEAAGLGHDPSEFSRYGSARQLYNFHVDNASAY